MTTTTTNVRSFWDRLYGTKMYTPGAELQLPRKVPMRVEPKSYFANERTFLSWTSMAVSLGGVSSALVGMSVVNPDTGSTSQVISKRTVDIITCIYAPLSMIIMAYALFTYEWRSQFMKKKQIGFFDDRVGPVTLCILVLITLLIITFIAIADYFY